MKIIYRLTPLLLFCLPLIGQSIHRPVISSAGNSATKAGIILEQTIGEVVIGYQSTSANVTGIFGFQQPFPVSSLSTSTVPDSRLEGVSIYPNPTTDLINIKLAQPTEDLSMSLMTIDGQHISSHTISNSLGGFIVSTTFLPPGIYLLRLSDNVRHTAGVFLFTKN